MKPNVLELIGSFEVGGSESQAVQLSRGLQRSGRFNVTVACLERQGPLISKIDWQEPSGIPEYRLSSFFDLNFLAQVRKCAIHLRAEKIDVVHTHDFYSNIFGMISAFAARVPVRIASKRETFSKTLRQMQVERQAYRVAHRIVVNADLVGRFLVDSGVPTRKVITIHNGLDPTCYYSIPLGARESMRRDLGIDVSSEKKLVTIVANLKSIVKDHDTFLRAAKRVRSQYKSVAFAIAGEGNLMDALRARAAHLGIENDVHFLGRCTRIPDLLSVSDICVLSSISEGFSNAILEYMAAAKPVVATRVGGAAEAVVEGETGYLVASGDDETMAARLLQLLRDPSLAERFGQEGRGIVQDRFSVSVQLEKTLGMYERLLSERNRIRSFV